MDVQLQELIDKIKKDGVAAAEKDSAKIIEASEKKAQAIIDEAQEKAAQIIKTAKSETQKMEKASEEAIVQAGRNMLLSFKDSLVGELDKIIQIETGKAGFGVVGKVHSDICYGGNELAVEFYVGICRFGVKVTGAVCEVECLLFIVSPFRFL